MTHTDLWYFKSLGWVDWEGLGNPIFKELDRMTLLTDWKTLIERVKSHTLPEFIQEYRNDRMKVLETSLLFGFKMKYEDLPRHIHHLDIVARRVIHYRLEIGK